MVINLGITNAENIDLALKIPSCDVSSTMQCIISLKIVAELWCQLKTSSRHLRCNYLLFLECPTLFFDGHLFFKMPMPGFEPVSLTRLASGSPRCVTSSAGRSFATGCRSWSSWPSSSSATSAPPDSSPRSSPTKAKTCSRYSYL